MNFGSSSAKTDFGFVLLRSGRQRYPGMDKARYGFQVGIIAILHTFNGPLKSTHMYTRMVTAEGCEHRVSGHLVFTTTELIDGVLARGVVRLPPRSFVSCLLKTELTH